MFRKTELLAAYGCQLGMVKTCLQGALFFLPLFLLACSHYGPGGPGMGSPREELFLPRQTSEERFAAMKYRLHLTAEQESKVRQLVEQEDDRRQELIEQCKTGIQDLKAGTEKKLAAVLTKEQMEEYQKLQEKQRRIRLERREKRGEEGMPPGRNGEMGGGMESPGGMGGGGPLLPQ